MADLFLSDDEIARQKEEKRLLHNARKKREAEARRAADPIGYLTKKRDAFNLWAAENEEALRASKQMWRNNNREKVRASSAASHQRNKHKHVEKRKAYGLEYYAANKAELNAKRVQWSKDNPERQNALNRASYQRHAPKRRAEAMVRHYATWPARYPVIKAYQETHKEKVSQYRRATSARRRTTSKTDSDYTADDVEAILRLQKFRCAMCRTTLKKKYHVDHIIPLAKRGTNARRNIQTLCPKCNQRKAAKHPIDFAREIGLLI